MLMLDTLVNKALAQTVFLHLAYFANDTHFRALILLLLINVSMNDVFAFIVGKDGKKISKSGQYEKPPTSDNYIAQSAYVGIRFHFIEAPVVVAEPPTDAATTVVMLQAASVTETR